jgi:hypothetical protein
VRRVTDDVVSKGVPVWPYDEYSSSFDDAAALAGVAEGSICAVGAMVMRAHEQRLLCGIGRRGSLSDQDDERIQLQYIEGARVRPDAQDGSQRGLPNAGE